MSSDTSWENWIIGIGVTMVTTLVGTIVTLTKYIESKYRTEIAGLKGTCDQLTVKSDACEIDRQELRVSIARLEERQLKLEHKQSDTHG